MRFPLSRCPPEPRLSHAHSLCLSCPQFELKDFGSLKRLQPNNSRVTAYWLPDGDEEVKRVYLYQGETYIGEAENRGQYAYNECAAERTEADEAKMLHQYKRAAKFDAMVRERRQDIGKTGRISKESARVIAEAPAGRCCGYSSLSCCR